MMFSTCSLKKTTAAACIAALLAALCTPCAAHAASGYLPGVTEAMTDPMYWAALEEMTFGPGCSSVLLADPYSIAELNRRTFATPGCMMTDLSAVPLKFDGVQQNADLLTQAAADLAYFKSSGARFDVTGAEVGDAFFAPILANTQDPAAQREAYINYGICTERTDIRALPTIQILTDEAGDNDFDYFQISALRVNEPVVIRGRSADGLWLYVNSTGCGGWVKASDIALCRTREEWESAWKIPEDHLLVVTSGKLYLEKSNRNPDIAGKMLTMGTTLRIAEDWEYSQAVTNRSTINNYAVWMPLRGADGYYTRKVVLISQHNSVSVGYLPMTSQNILNVAFSMLGDAYGWGSMLDSADCSAYIRDIYKCFGLELPRNTTWQSAMPAVKCDLSALPQNADGDAVKGALLNTLAPGAVLYFPGHTMMYLGEVDGQHYVISAVSSMADPETGKYLRVRGVVINNLDIKRLSGKSWMNCLDLALVPYQAG